MTIQATEKLTLGVLDAHALDDEAIRRLGFSADAIVTFSRGKAPDQADRFAELLPGVPVTDGGTVDDIRGAMIACGRQGVLVIVTPQPDNPAKFVARAIQGAATVAEEGGDVIAVQTIRRSVPVDKIAWLTETGEVSGYGVLYAAGFAKKLNAEVVLITPSGATRTPRTPAAVELARQTSEEHNIAYSVISDPSPIDRVLRNPDGIGVVVHPILDAPGGRSLLHWGELPPSSVASGAPEAVVRLLEGFEGNVVMVFDGTQLLAGAVPVGRRVGAAGAGLLIALGIGLGAATPAMAAEATGNTAVVQVEGGDWAQVVEDVLRGLTFEALPHEGGRSALEVTNTSGHIVGLQVTGYHGHGGSVNREFTQDVGPTFTFETPQGGTKHWSSGVIVSIDGQTLEHPIDLEFPEAGVSRVPEGQVLEAVEANAPKPEPITWTDKYTPPSPTPLDLPAAPVEAAPGPVTIVEQVPESLTPVPEAAPVEAAPGPATIVEQVPESLTPVPDPHAPVEAPPGSVTIVEQVPESLTPVPDPHAPVEAPPGSVTIVEQVPESLTAVPEAAPVEATPGTVTTVLTPPPAVPGAIPNKVPQPMPDAPGGPTPPLVPVATPQPKPETPEAQPLLPPGPDSLKAPGQVPQASPNLEPGADKLTPPPAEPGAIPNKVPQPMPDAPDGPTPPLVPVATPQPKPETPEAQPLLPPGPDSLKAPGQVPQASPNLEPGADKLTPPPAEPGAIPNKVPQPMPDAPDGPTPPLVPVATPQPKPETPEAQPLLPPGPDSLKAPGQVPQASPNLEPGADKLTPPPAEPGAIPNKVPQPMPDAPDGPTPPLVPVATPDTKPATPVAQPLLPPGPDSLKAPGQVPQAAPNLEPGADMLTPPPAEPGAIPNKVPQPMPEAPDTDGPQMQAPPQPATPQLPGPQFVDTVTVAGVTQQAGQEPGTPQAPAPQLLDTVTEAGVTEQAGDSATPQLPGPQFMDTVTEAGGTEQAVDQPGSAAEASTSTSRDSSTQDASEASDVEQLAHTGGSAGLAVLGAGLVAGGVGLAAVGRKRDDEDADQDPGEDLDAD